MKHASHVANAIDHASQALRAIAVSALWKEDVGTSKRDELTNAASCLSNGIGWLALHLYARMAESEGTAQAFFEQGFDFVVKARDAIHVCGDGAPSAAVEAVRAAVDVLMVARASLTSFDADLEEGKP